MSEQIIKRCDAICYNEDEMHLGSYRTFKMIKDEATQLTQQIHYLEQQLQAARRAGWEQAKREAAIAADAAIDSVRWGHDGDCGVGQKVEKAIASMEYKEASNE